MKAKSQRTKNLDFKVWECMLLYTESNAPCLRLLKQLNQEGHCWDTVQVVRNSICIQNVDGFYIQNRVQCTFYCFKRYTSHQNSCH